MKESNECCPFHLISTSHLFRTRNDNWVEKQELNFKSIPAHIQQMSTPNEKTSAAEVTESLFDSKYSGARKSRSGCNVIGNFLAHGKHGKTFCKSTISFHLTPKYSSNWPAGQIAIEKKIYHLNSWMSFSYRKCLNIFLWQDIHALPRRFNILT